jgi:hypothetical protein
MKFPPPKRAGSGEGVIDEISSPSKWEAQEGWGVLIVAFSSFLDLLEKFSIHFFVSIY